MSTKASTLFGGGDRYKGLNAKQTLYLASTSLIHLTVFSIHYGTLTRTFVGHELVTPVADTIPALAWIIGNAGFEHLTCGLLAVAISIIPLALYFVSMRIDIFNGKALDNNAWSFAIAGAVMVLISVLCLEAVSFYTFWDSSGSSGSWSSPTQSERGPLVLGLLTLITMVCVQALELATAYLYHKVVFPRKELSHE